VFATWSPGGFNPVRLLILPAGAGCLLIYAGPSPSTMDWVVMLVAACLTLASGTVPLVVALSQSALLVIVERFTDASSIPVKWVASLAVFEVAARRWGLPAVLAAAALAAAYLTKAGAAEFTANPAALLFKITAVVGAPVLLGGYQRSLQRIAEQARAQAADAERQQELRTVAARMTERTTIARELHDMIAHHLASIALRTGVARHVLSDADPRAREVLDDVHANATTALTDLRKLVTALRDSSSETNDVGYLLVESAELPSALHDFAERARRAGLKVDLSVEPAIARLDAVRGLTVLRLVQEGLTNAAKHAGPGVSVSIAVGYDHGTARVEITDDGTGHGNGHNGSGPGMGLVGMRERVALAGGELQAGAASGGWRLCAVLPDRAT
jgi:signal transduction histidine kinase